MELTKVYVNRTDNVVWFQREDSPRDRLKVYLNPTGNDEMVIAQVYVGGEWKSSHQMDPVQAAPIIEAARLFIGQ